MAAGLYQTAEASSATAVKALPMPLAAAPWVVCLKPAAPALAAMAATISIAGFFIVVFFLAPGAAPAAFSLVHTGTAGACPFY